jgi:Lon protease-like protein
VAPIDRYRSPVDLPQQLALFPLRGVILLPRSELPLNIFEPRYLSMIDDTLSGSRVIGVIQPEQTSAPIESPAGKAVPLKQVGASGRITGYQELSDGRLHIVLTGISRFVLGEETESDLPYRLGKVDHRPFSADFSPDDSLDSIDRETLLDVIKAFLAARKLGADWDAIARAPLEPLINGLSAMIRDDAKAILDAISTNTSEANEVETDNFC